MFKHSRLRTFLKIGPEKYEPLQNSTSEKEKPRSTCLYKKEFSIQGNYKVICLPPHPALILAI